MAKLSANCVPLKATKHLGIRNPHKEEKGHSHNHTEKLESEVPVSVVFPSSG